jgi:hypothetical protein
MYIRKHVFWTFNIVNRCYITSYTYFIELIDLTSEPSDLFEIIINRPKIREDLLFEFEYKEILSKKLNFGIMGFNGKLEAGQGIGVEREIMSSFFNEFYQSCCIGASEKVPMIRHDFQKGEWEACARIICYGIKIGYYPIKLSYAFMKSSFQSENSVTQEDLVKSFFKYVSCEDKETLERNLKELDDDQSELLEVLSTYKCFSLPTKDNLNEIISQLAHKELIQRPKYIANIWLSIFQSVKFPNLFLLGLKQMYTSKIASGRRIVGLFSASNLTSPQDTICFEHLKTYTRNLSQDQLEKLLRLMTGSDVITVDKITIEFVNVSGIKRFPVFRTCGPTLQLPNTYQCYNELAEEFSELLNHNAHALGFDIV